MRKSITIAIALSSLAGVALATSTIARADTTDDAIRVAYKASNATQSAIYKDVCVGNEDDSLSDHRPGLKGKDVKFYDVISNLVIKAFGETNGTDNAVREVQTKFCDALENR